MADNDGLSLSLRVRGIIPLRAGHPFPGKEGPITLFTTSVRELPSFADRPSTRWLITHYAGRVPRSHYDAWVPALSPSKQLHYIWSASWRALPPEHWWTTGYCRLWAAEKLADPAYMEAINRAAEIAMVGDLILACWCQNENVCHRSLVASDIHAAISRQQDLPEQVDVPSDRVMRALRHNPRLRFMLSVVVSAPRPLATPEVAGRRMITSVHSSLCELEQMGLVAIVSIGGTSRWCFTDMGRSAWHSIEMEKHRDGAVLGLPSRRPPPLFPT